MTGERSVRRSFQALQDALRAHLPQVAGRLRPPEPLDPSLFGGRRGHEHLQELWTLTGGQVEDSVLGVIGGAQLIGPSDCAEQRAIWDDMMDESGIAKPSWYHSSALDPSAVRNVYFSAGWFPILKDPLEANYLAVDLDPLPGGTPGQIILCGRDEDDKCIVAPDLIALLDRLTEECLSGRWLYGEEGDEDDEDDEALDSSVDEASGQGWEEDDGDEPYVGRHGGRLLSAAREWMPHEEED